MRHDGPGDEVDEGIAEAELELGHLSEKEWERWLNSGDAEGQD